MRVFYVGENLSPCITFYPKCSLIAVYVSTCMYSYGTKWKTGTGRQYFADIIVYLQPL